jgi:hypothetical protein
VVKNLLLGLLLVELFRIPFLVRSCLYHILTKSLGLSVRYCRFHIYVYDLQMYHTSAASDFQWCIDKLNLDLQHVHQWVAANGLKLNPMKSQLIVISRCRVDIPPPTLLIRSNLFKVVPKLNNLGFVLNEKLKGILDPVLFKAICIAYTG